MDYREDCALFWLEMSDLLKIPSGGTFQLGLMKDLFDVYIAKGALRQLPMVSAAEREPLSQHLQEKNAEPTHFDEYVRAEGKLGYFQATRRASMRNVLARLAKASMGNSGDRRSHLNEILNTSVLCKMFREFLQGRNSAETLLFIIDALAFEDLVNTFNQEPELRAAQDGSHDDYCLRQAQKIFNKYIRYGSKAEICLSGTVKEKLLREIVEYPLGAEVFNDAVLLCSAELVHSHLDQFYNTPEYIAYKAMKNREGSAKSTRKSSTSALKKNSLDKVKDPGASTLNSDATTAPGDQSDDSDILTNSDQMYTGTVGEFQLLPHGQRHYIQSKARKIFDKYVRRGGKLEIELPADVRRDILWKLSAPTEHTFSDAQKYVFNYWEHNYLDKFRHHKFHVDMLNALQKLPNFGLSGAPSDSKAGNFHRHGDVSSFHGDWMDVTKITLREFLDLEFLRRHFRIFLEKERCANELYFYFEILNFQQFPTSDYLSRQAKKLFNHFCDPTSREFVSFQVAVRTEIENNLNNPSPAMFNKVQEEIMSFFATTLFPKFQQSEIYQTIRITNSELRAAKLMTSGNGFSADVQFRGQHGSTMEDTASYAHPVTVASRVRNLVAPGASTGFDLLDDQVTVALILEHQETRALFLFFSEEIFCTESIYFWLDCNEFKDIPHKSYLKLRAQKIYRKYISGHAKLQVNLESSIVKEIVRQLDDPTRNLFVPAQKSITKMLERDTLPKFRHSKHVSV
uniref:RGS domain-containing protein n=1 Tax=Globisporangium ultimum (strain ATCC 200006 / CBS 805.95 / DAOM BR144) TaxID=431595 RepID=K3X539_GLOUD